MASRPDARILAPVRHHAITSHDIKFLLAAPHDSESTYMHLLDKLLHVLDVAQLHVGQGETAHDLAGPGIDLERAVQVVEGLHAVLHPGRNWRPGS